MPLKYSDDKSYHYESIVAPSAPVQLTVECPSAHVSNVLFTALRKNKDTSIGALKRQIEWFCAPCNEAYITYLD